MPGHSLVQLAPGVWAHRVVCASCGGFVECPWEGAAVEWLFTHRGANHAPGKPAGVTA